MSNVREPDPNVVITHPNRDTAAAKTTRAAVLLVLVASTVLLVIITVGSVGVQAGAQGLQVLFGILFVYFAYRVSKWSAGVLPIAAGTAVFAGVFAAVSAPGWFDRGGYGYDSPPIPESVLGVLVFAFAVLQLVGIVIFMRAFTQNWQVEVEVPRSQAHATA
jgi:hypothetical protein